MIKVLAIVHFSAFGGPHNRTAEVARVLAGHGVETIIAIPEEAGSALNRLRAGGMNVVQLPIERIRNTRDFYTHIRTVRSAWPAIQSVRSLIRSHSIDVVALNALGAPHLGFAARLEHTALVWELIDTYPHPAVRKAFMPLVRRWADVLMTTGQAVANQHPGASKFGGRRVNFFPCVDTDKFSFSMSQRAEARRRLEIDDNSLVIGTVGNLGPMKGHRTFFRAAELVRRRKPGTKFVILGAKNEQFGQYWNDMERFAESLGFVTGDDLLVVDPGSDVAELAQAFDIFWMTSEPRGEGIPTAIGEAMALELPVVAPRVGAIPECISNAETGFLVEPNNPQAMVAPTMLLMEEPALRARMGAEGRALARQTYSVEIGAAAHLRAYEMAISWRETRSRLRSAGSERARITQRARM